MKERVLRNREGSDDGEHIIYVNGADKDVSTELGKLMHDFFCTDPDDMHYKELADKVRYFKEDEKGVATMCKVMEDMRTRAQEMLSGDRLLRVFVGGSLWGFLVNRLPKVKALPLSRLMR